MGNLSDKEQYSGQFELFQKVLCCLETPRSLKTGDADKDALLSAA
jgi:hypothetical protein